MFWRMVVMMIALLAAGGCAEKAEKPAYTPQAEKTERPAEGKDVSTGGENLMKITSTAFAHEGAIPSRFTCDGQDISPELSWSDVPAGAKSLALINDDPDAPVGLWVHWVLYNIPATAKGLPENVDKTLKPLPDGSVQGTSSWGRTGYGGPCPPSGTHRYFFKLYALDTTLDIGPAKKDQLEQAMKGHVLAEAQLMGRYARSK